jgi:hypothetical protein
VTLGSLQFSIFSGAVRANDFAIADNPAFSKTPFFRRPFHPDKAGGQKQISDLGQGGPSGEDFSTATSFPSPLRPV